MGYRQGYLLTGKYPRAAHVPMHNHQLCAQTQELIFTVKISLKVDQLLKYDVFQAANTNGGTYLKWSNPLKKCTWSFLPYCVLRTTCLIHDRFVDIFSTSERSNKYALIFFVVVFTTK